MSAPTILHLKEQSAAKDYGIDIAGNLELRSGKIGFQPPVRFKSLNCLGQLKIGAYSFMRESYVSGEVIIGRYCSIGANFSVGEPDHPMEWMSTGSFQYRESKFGFHQPMSGFRYLSPPNGIDIPTRIGNDVWIGSNVMVLRGVKVGDGAILAAGAVVTKDVAPYTIVGGVPAKKIRDRFPSAEISTTLRRSRWWEFLAPSLSGLPFDKPIEAVKELLRRESAGEIHRMRIVLRVLRRRPRGLEIVINAESEATSR